MKNSLLVLRIRCCAALAVLAAMGTSTPVAAGDYADLPASADAICPRMTGQSLPPLSLTTASGEAFDVTAAVAARPTVLVFYRGGWCPYCNTQLAGLKDIEKELAGLGYQVFAVSPDSPANLGTATGAEGASYTLLSDSRLLAARALGIAFRVDEQTRDLYRGYGIDLEKASGQSHFGLPVASVFLVDTAGIIRFSYVNPDYKVRVDPDVLLAAAKAAMKKQN
jgi:peroxiredoxin